MCVYLHVCTCTCTCICLCIVLCLGVCVMYMYIYMYVHVHIYIYVHAHMYMYNVHVYLCIVYSWCILCYLLILFINNAVFNANRVFILGALIFMSNSPVSTVYQLGCFVQITW